MAAITQEFLAHVDLARLQRAARGLQDGSLDVVVEGQDEGAVWGLVRNGSDKVYSVQVAHGYASCSCPDWAYRHRHGMAVCKHGLALALTATQDHPQEQPLERKHRPNLKLARVREGFCG